MTQTGSAPVDRGPRDCGPPPGVDTGVDVEADVAKDAEQSPLATAPLAQAGLGMFAVAFGVVALIDASSLDMFGKHGVPGPGLFPTATAIAVAVLGLMLVAVSVMRRVRCGAGDELAGVRPELLRAFSVWAGFLICIVLLGIIGFVPATVLLIAYLVLVVERIRGVKALVAIVATPVLAYLLFVYVLGVELPTSALIEGI